MTHATHELKCWPEFFVPLRSGKKPFEIRLDDRDYAVGDTLVEHEFIPNRGANGIYTNRKPFKLKVTYVLRGPAFGLLKDWCIMGVKRI